MTNFSVLFHLDIPQIDFEHMYYTQKLCFNLIVGRIGTKTGAIASM